MIREAIYAFCAMMLNFLILPVIDHVVIKNIIHRIFAVSHISNMSYRKT